MKKIFTTALVSGLCCFSYAQNVGIGTTNPQTNLHVYSAAANSIIRNEILGGPSSNEASLELQSGASLYDFLEIRKWRTGASGSITGISLSGLSQITTGVGSTAGLLIGTKPAYPIYFTTSNTERMRIASNGLVGIGTTSPQYILHVEAGSHSGIYSRSTVIAPDSSAIIGILDVPVGVGARAAGVRGESKSTTDFSIGVYGIQHGGGWGVAGTVKEGGSDGWGAGVYGEAGINGFNTGTGGYGVYGSNYNTGGIAGYFRDNVLTAETRALKTSGSVQFTGIGEGAGKVLTSDENGNANWASLTGSHNHLGETWSGDTLVGLRIYNTSAAFDATGLIAAAVGGGSSFTYGIKASSNSTNGIGIYGIANSGTYAGLIGNTGVAGTAGTGTGVFGASITGPSIYGYKATTASYQGPVGVFYNANTTNNSPVVQIINTDANTAPTSLELRNGFIKASGTNRMAFTVTATASNSSAHILNLDYINQSSSDILLVTHNYNPLGVGGNYLNKPFGVYWNGSNWTIYIEDLSSILGKAFNIMVIKQ